MNRNRIWSVVILIAACMLADANAAQVLFTPELTLSEEYTDNLFLTPHNKTDDFITTAGVGLTGQILSRTAGLELNYSPSYNVFADNSDLNYWRQSAYLSAWDDVSRFTRVELHDNLLETENPRDHSVQPTPEHPAEGPVIGIDPTRRGRIRYLENVASASLSHRFGANDMGYLSMTHSLLRDQNRPADELSEDYDNLQPGVGLNYWFTPQWGMEITGYYSNRDYVDRNDREEYFGSLRLLRNFSRTLSGFVEYRQTVLNFDQGTEEDYQVYDPSIGLRYQFQETAYISIAGGYYIQDFAGQIGTEKGFHITSLINKRWDFRTSYVDLTGGSGYEIADTGSQDLGLDIYYQGNLEIGYNVTPRLTSSVFSTYRYDKYPNQIPERTDNTIYAGTRIRYQATRWMNVGLTYRFSNVQSTEDSEEYSENSVLLIITMAPARAIRLNN